MLRFIFGSSGSGKSHKVTEEIIDGALKEPERNFFILVPDQFTLQTQTDVISRHPGHGILNIDVLSFSRLTHRVFDETGYPKEKPVDDLGKTLLLRRAAQTVLKDLPVIGKGMKKAGYADEVKSAISEFMQYNITPETLETFIEASDERQALKARLCDLKNLYAAFGDYISKKYITPEETLNVLASRIPESKLLKDSVMAIDGFTGFTPVQYSVLKALYMRAKDLTFTLEYRGEPPFFEADTQESLFHLTLKTAHDLEKNMWDAENEADPSLTPPLNVWRDYRRKNAGDIYLKGDESVRHVAGFTEKPGVLTHLEKNLFAYPSETYTGEVGNIFLSCAQDPEEEVSATFREIRRMIRLDNTLMYRDFAVVCADENSYTDLIDRISGDFDIPVFEDRTASVMKNPLFEYLRSVILAAATSFDTDSVFSYLRSGLSSVSPEEADILELYVSACGVRGKKKWTSPFETEFYDNIKRTPEERERIRDTAETVRAKTVGALQKIHGAFSEKAVSGEVTKRLYALMLEDGVYGKLNSYADEFSAMGDEAKALEYRQIFAKVTALLESLYALVGDEHLSAREYAEVLEAGFSELKVGTIPQNVDRVQVGDLTRTRMSRVKHLFFVGVHEKAIPKNTESGGLLSEADREFLRKKCPGAELAPSGEELMLRERLYLYMLLSKPVSSLTLSWPRVDLSRKSLRPAYIVARLQKLFPRLKTGYPGEIPMTEKAESAVILKKTLAPYMRLFASGYLPGDLKESFFVSCAALSHFDFSSALTLRDAAFYRHSDITQTRDITELLYGKNHLSSVSRLELFASCAYAHFMRYGLKLAEKATSYFDAASLGNIYHAVLDDFSERLHAENVSWTDFTPEQGERFVSDALSEYASQSAKRFFEGKQGEYTLRRIKRVLVRTVTTLQYQLQKGDFTPLYTEADFKGKGLYGRIDRIDTALLDGKRLVKILDYKSGAKDFDAAYMYHGLQQQLITYMDAALDMMKEKNPREDVLPAALLYYRVTDPIMDADKNSLTPLSDGREVEALIDGALRTTGIVNSDESVLASLDKTMESRSDVIPVSRKKDGEFTASSNVFSEKEYGLISDHVKKTEKDMALRMDAGDISVNPYAFDGENNACKFCVYKSICGFDENVPGYEYRLLEKMTLREAIEKIHAVEKENKT